MIVECPQCKTAHSKGEQELGSGAPILCRRCGASFPAPAAQPAGGAASAASRIATPAQPAGIPDLALDPDPAAGGDRSSGATSPGRAAPAGPATFDDLALELDLAAEAAPPAAGPPPNARPAGAATRSERGEHDAGASLVLELDESGERRRVGATPPLAADAALTPVPSPIPAPAVPFTGASRAAGAGQGRSDTRARDLEAVSWAAGARGHVFPGEAGARFLTDLVAYVRAAPWWIRLAAGVAAVLLLALPVALALALQPGHPTNYLSEAEPLVAGPAVSGAYPELGRLDRGSRVEVLETAGELALVRDSLGRVGFLRSRTLRRSAPPATPAQAFADCGRSPVDSSNERCQSRAQEQYQSCRGFCGTGGDDAACLERCQRRFSDCLGTCEQPATQAAAAAAAAPQPRSVRTEAPPSAAVATDTPPEPVKRKAKRPVKTKKKPH